MRGVQVSCGDDLRRPPTVPSVTIRLQMVTLDFITLEAAGSYQLWHQWAACWGTTAWFDYESPQDIFTIHRLLIKPTGGCCVASGGREGEGRGCVSVCVRGTVCTVLIVLANDLAVSVWSSSNLHSQVDPHVLPHILIIYYCSLFCSLTKV